MRMVLKASVLLLGVLAQLCIARPQSRLDLSSILTGIFANDVNRPQSSQMKVDYQNMASKAHPDHDNAPNPLFSNVDPALLNLPTYSSFINLVATFTIPDADVNDPLTPQRTQAIASFIDQISSTKVFNFTYAYLLDNGFISGDVEAFKRELSALWFTPYARTQAVGSSAFESVFVGETQGNDVIRMNNWLGFHLKEKNLIFNYHGWFSRSQPVGMSVDLQFMWGAAEAFEKSFLLMTSPEVEVMGYTLCALAGNGSCSFSIQEANLVLHATTRDENGFTVIDECYPSTGAAAATTKAPKTDAPPDTDFQTTVDAMRQADTDRAQDSDYKLNWGNKENGDQDVSPNPLFTSVNEAVFNKPIYQKQISIYDQGLFHADTCIQEPDMSGFRKQIMQDWLDTVTNTTVFQKAYQYLLSKGKCSSLSDLKTKLFMLWFGTYNRCTSNKNIQGSSGWEHVFCGEWKGTVVDGHHSWVNYYRQEKAGQINYHGYYSYEKQLTGTFQYEWAKAFKKTGGFLIGTSPYIPLGVVSYTEACSAGTCIATAYPTD